MTKIDRMTMRDAETIVEEIKLALEGIADDFGLEIDVRTTARDSISLKVEVDAKIEGKSLAETPEGAIWKSRAAFRGLPGDAIGKQFISRGTAYVVVGWKDSRPKYPITAKRVSDGRSFKFPIAHLRSATFV